MNRGFFGNKLFTFFKGVSAVVGFFKENSVKTKFVLINPYVHIGRLNAQTEIFREESLYSQKINLFISF